MFKYVVAHFEEKWVSGLGSMTELASSTLRYVDVIWFVFFMFSNFYQLDSHNKTCIALANLRWNICKNLIGIWTSPFI